MALLVHYLFPLLLLLPILRVNAKDTLAGVIDELNEAFEIETIIIYNPYSKDTLYLRELQPVGQLLMNSANHSLFNYTELVQFLNEKILFVLHVEGPPIELFEHFHFQFQQAHFLLLPDESPTRSELWPEFVHRAWELGYSRLLFLHSSGPGAPTIYEKTVLPHIQIRPSNVSGYVANRAIYRNLHGLEVRVAVYYNAPRSFFYHDKHGIRRYGGYFLRFLLHFLDNRNATFVPVFTTNNSANDCIKALHALQVDTCADALAFEKDKSFVVTHPIRIPYANVLVRYAKPLSPYLYLMAPFHPTVWICLCVYIAVMVCFMSFIHWQRQGRWIFSNFLLEVFSSLLFAGFALKDLHGRERYILFGVIFVAGFIYSTFYLGCLKSMLTTEMFEPQISSFEQLLEANTTIMIDEYNFYLSKRYHLPDMLWPLVQVVSGEELREHRTVFDQNYAYILFSDRMHLYDTAQKYLKHPRFRRIPINIFHLFSGFPMRSGYFLRPSLNEGWSNAFESGLVQKLSEDADREIISLKVDSYEYLPTEYYEVLPLGLDYFIMPAMALLLGYGFALVAFLIELLAWRMHSQPASHL